MAEETIKLMEKIIVTGVHGFIGCSVALKLLKDNYQVIGIDREYCTAMPIKKQRGEILQTYSNFKFINIDLSSFDKVNYLLKMYRVGTVFHCAGQYSIVHTTDTMKSYVSGNLCAFTYLLEACKLNNVKRFIYASSSWAGDSSAGKSLYGASKVYNELAAATYSYQTDMETIGLRYSSVYGPWMRPDTGPYQIIQKLYSREKISIKPSFYSKVGFIDIDDAVEVTFRFIQKEKFPEKSIVVSVVSENERASMTDVLLIAKKHTGIEPVLDGSLSMSSKYGGTPDTALLKDLIDYSPATTLDVSIRKVADWYYAQYI